MEKQTSSKSTYEIIWIKNLEDLRNNEILVNDFFSLYEDPSNFPDPDEREEPKFIKERIAEESNDPYTHLMAFNLIEDGIKKFVAGCIVEFYPESSCSLVTYIFVNKAYRGIKVGLEQLKIGEILLKGEKGLKGLLGFFKTTYNIIPNAVFFESNNPFETPEEMDSMPPGKRLKFFKNLGARKVDFNYIQPPLGDDKGLVTNLFLLTFPDLGGLENTIRVENIMSFIMELAKSLDRNKEVNSNTKYGLQNYQNDLNVLKNHLKGILQIRDYTFIGLHFNDRNILVETYNNLLINSDKKGNIMLKDIPGVLE